MNKNFNKEDFLDFSNSLFDAFLITSCVGVNDGSIFVRHGDNIVTFNENKRNDCEFCEEDIIHLNNLGDVIYSEYEENTKPYDSEFIGYVMGKIKYIKYIIRVHPLPCLALKARSKGLSYLGKDIQYIKRCYTRGIPIYNELQDTDFYVNITTKGKGFLENNLLIVEGDCLYIAGSIVEDIMLDIQQIIRCSELCLVKDGGDSYA